MKWIKGILLCYSNFKENMKSTKLWFKILQCPYQKVLQHSSDTWSNHFGFSVLSSSYLLVVVLNRPHCLFKCLFSFWYKRWIGFIYKLFTEETGFIVVYNLFVNLTLINNQKLFMAILVALQATKNTPRVWNNDIQWTLESKGLHRRQKSEFQKGY